MALEFERPIGAAADVRELEYISALHQTDSEDLRKDASIRDIDIVHFLSSRYGIKVSQEQVQKTILHGMGGGDEDCIDLMEMVAILFIPTLLKAASTENLEDLVKPPELLLQQVVNMILHDITGDVEPKLLTPGLLKLMFTKYDERDLAGNKSLIHDMIDAATEGKKDATFSVETFARGLTYDVQLYDVENENKLSTNFDDVFSSGSKGVPLKEHKLIEREDIDDDSKSTDAESNHEDVEQAKQGPTEKEGLERLVTLSAIDFVAGTYQSKVLVVCLWSTFIVSYFTYYWRIGYSYDDKCPSYEARTGFNGNSDAFSCTLIANVVVWILKFLLLSVYGLLFMGLGSIGNGVRVKNPFRPLIGMFAVGCFTYLPLLLPNNAFSGLGGHFLKFISLFLGSTAMAIHFTHIVSIVLPWLKKCPWFPRPGNIEAEARGKKAAANKITSMGENAMEVVQNFEDDNVIDSFFGQALLNFSKAGEHYTDAGGIGWTYQRIYSKDLSMKEGISFSARFLASNFTQFIIAAILLIGGIYLTNYISGDYDYKQNVKSGVTSLIYSLFDTHIQPEHVEHILGTVDQLAVEWAGQLLIGALESEANVKCEEVAKAQCSDIPQCVAAICELFQSASESQTTLAEEQVTSVLGEYNLTQNNNFDHDTLALELATVIGNATAESLNSLYPEERYMVTIPFVFGTAIAVFTALATAIIYMPSVASTIIKLRSGVIPSLRDRNFLSYRLKVHNITLLSGSMFWGVFFSSLLFGVMWGFILFLCLWQVTRHLVLQVLSIAIGVGITITLKTVFLTLYRKSYWRAFYRTRPAPSNVANVVTEAANFALSVAFVFVRMTKLVGVAALYAGRLDTFFLAPGVGRLCTLELDNYPSIFLTDILVKEAHRHPYLELMGLMYLMKLKYADSFGKTAGSCWRLLFVTALMPWLQKYRILLQTGGVEDDGADFGLSKRLSFPDFDEDDMETVAIVKETTDLDGNKKHETLYIPPLPLRAQSRPYGGISRRSFRTLGESSFSLARNHRLTMPHFATPDDYGVEVNHQTMPIYDVPRDDRETAMRKNRNVSGGLQAPVVSRHTPRTSYGMGSSDRMGEQTRDERKTMQNFATQDDHPFRGRDQAIPPCNTHDENRENLMRANRYVSQGLQAPVMSRHTPRTKYGRKSNTRSAEAAEMGCHPPLSPDRRHKTRRKIKHRSFELDDNGCPPLQPPAFTEVSGP